MNIRIHRLGKPKKDRAGVSRQFDQLNRQIHVAEMGHARLGDKQTRRAAANRPAADRELVLKWRVFHAP